MLGSTEPKKRFIASVVATKYSYLCAVRGGGIWLKMGHRAAQSRKSSFLLLPVSLCQKNGIGWFDVSADARIHCKFDDVFSLWLTAVQTRTCPAWETSHSVLPLMHDNYRKETLHLAGKRGGGGVQHHCICVLQNVQQPAASDSLIWCGSSIWKRKLLVSERFPVG